MSKLLVVIGVFQLISGIIIIGLDSKTLADAASSIFSSSITTATELKPVLAAAMVLLSGLFGVLTICCSNEKNMDVIYLIGATVATVVTAATVWDKAIEVYECVNSCPFSKETQNIDIVLLVFNSLSCIMSVLGIVSSALIACRL